MSTLTCCVDYEIMWFAKEIKVVRVRISVRARNSVTLTLKGRVPLSDDFKSYDELLYCTFSLTSCVDYAILWQREREQ
jgi:hypothetical protein